MNTEKKWGSKIILSAVILLCCIGGLTAFVDPYFHYHAPLSFLEYPLNNQRYQNDGIVRNFDYDAIITGTSMTENFKTTEFDNLFNVNSIKVPFSGATYKEITQNLWRGLSENPETKIVIRSLDFYCLISDKDAMGYNSYPTYLTDDNLFNDVKYLLNKEILFDSTLDVLQYTINGGKSTSFDEYSSWGSYFTYGKDEVLKRYTRPEKNTEIYSLSVAERDLIAGNIAHNIVELAEAYPDTKFYCYFPPYSIFFWDSLKQTGSFTKYIEAFTLATELMLQQENIYVFSFFDAYDVVTNLENYKDTEHHTAEINTQILHWMKNDEHKLTSDNFRVHWNDVKSYYDNYDYSKLFN